MTGTGQKEGLIKVLCIICGEGLGHTTRTLQLASFLEENGCECHLAAYGKSFRFLENKGWPRLYRTPAEVTLSGTDGYFSLSKTVWSSKGAPLHLLQSMHHIRRLIRETKADIVIGDTMYGSVPAARLEKIPVIFMTNQNNFAAASDEEGIPWKILSRIVEEYLTLPDAVVIPDFAPPWGICEYNLKIDEEDRPRYHFVGPMLDGAGSTHERTKETVFASFGGEPFKIPLYGMLAGIAKERPDLLFEVFCTSEGLPPGTENFRTFGYVPDFYAHMSRAYVTVLHGGLTTIHESLLFRKPVVMIVDPFHPEQWNNARKVADIGAGVLLEGGSITPHTLSVAIDEAMLIEPPDYRQRFLEEDGRRGTLAVIRDLLRKKETGILSHTPVMGRHKP